MLVVEHEADEPAATGGIASQSKAELAAYRGGGARVHDDGADADERQGPGSARS